MLIAHGCFEDGCLTLIALCLGLGIRDGVRFCDRKVAAMPGIQDTTKDRWILEGRQTQPVYRTICRHQCGCLAIADKTVVTDWEIAARCTA